MFLLAGPGCCTNLLDVELVLDASGSVQLPNWRKTVDFARVIGNKLFDLNAKTRIGVIDFSARAHEALPPTWNRQYFESMLDILKKRYQNGITKTRSALNKALKVFGRIHRKYSQKLLIIVTDGKPTTFQGNEIELIRGPTNSLKNLGVKIIAVGVTNQINDEVLQFLATDDSCVFHVNNYCQLLEDVAKIVHSACPNRGKLKFTPCSERC